MSVFVKAFYGRSNLGDDAIFARILEWANSQGQSLVVATDTECDQLKEFCGLYPDVRVEFVPDRFMSWLKALIRTDYAVLGGGGLFPSDAPRAMLSKLLAVLYARLVGNKVFMIGLGVNPVAHQLSRLFWKFMVAASSHVSVRDHLSFKAVCSCLGSNLRSRVTECSDIVLSLNLGIFDRAIQKRTDRREPSAPAEGCLVSIASPWSEAEVKAHPERMERFCHAMHGLLGLLVEKGYSPILVPFYLPSDTAVAKALAEPFGEAVYVEESESPLVRLAWFSRVRFAVTMRFHSLVFAGCFGKPAYSIAYDHKLVSLSKLMGTGRFVSRFGIRASEFYGRAFDLDESALLSGVSELIDNLAAVQADVSNRMPEIRVLSNRNFDAINRAIASA